MPNTVIYNNGELELNISVDSETIWLSQKQLCELFDRDKSVISRHLRNIFKENELDKNSVVAKNATTGNDGKIYQVDYYNLDVVISVGYRVNSLKATKFRQWATKILRTYIQDGYVLNTHKITEQRLFSLEKDIQDIKSQISNKTLEVKQGIFYDGEIFDAYVFLNDLVKSANKSIRIIDNYIDESILTLLSQNQNISIQIYTTNISKKLTLDIKKYNNQYNNLSVKISKNFHDRFIIIDEKEVYPIGASLKDLGKKVFAFSKMRIKADDIISKL
ncbi:RhuM family protein [Arcobacter roscoffensis]|uniref:Virulence RhuM family protein n=1 Tax=Arcobacter roscoffensis TaxID=2961520 RepID=A0ABY5E489_9BACT|nr:RhuM family protein [Arcobacter roscoffensis]UTJ05938.1 virulence RhuM family protein [Arcobacter roscoffensis]